jgi:hypothetical protein
LCTGIFIIKNTPIGIQILKDCIGYANNRNCLSDIKNSVYAGLCYEQGAMNVIIQNKYNNNTTVVKQDIFSNNYICNYNTFIMHYFGQHNKQNLEKCFLRQ